ncbi:ABC transporter G family member 10-like isoform X2 [Malus sylvestris]|uniref:ABC transporter G family member 10-like isoform X2 n=1 Tax=Malus sylvestris TaxID=3752 RepID=UPI0021AD43B0|nr:ABC transporter G family member 10-like isoform X2 [Malus sylvestris]
MELPVKMPVSGSHITPYRIETRNLCYKLSTRFDEMKHLCCSDSSRTVPKFILKDVSCEARPAEITAIVGPSGAGKTTLLDILAGNISPAKVGGQVLVNDQPMDTKSFRRMSGYVTQDDALFPLLTVEETLVYSALLRLPGGIKEAADKVRKLMKELGLEHVAGSRIGWGSNNGISGGERRRVSIGVDLVHDPAVVLIDEPTSGLDSASAFHVVSLLKTMVFNQGKTIVLTIHQPGFRILEMFDRVVLLSNGAVMHNGSLHLLKQRLNFAGHRIPNHVNLLEFAIDVIVSLEGTQTSEALHNQCFRPLEQRFVCSNNLQKKLLVYPNSRPREVVILGQRFCSNIFRTKQLFVTRVIQALVAGFVLGSIFFNVGREKGNISLQTQTGFFAFSLTFLLSSTTEGLPIFLQERRILMTPVYWLVGLRRDIDGFLYFSFVVWMVLLMSNSVVACFSALVPNFIMGSSLISGLMGAFFLFSGYFISKDRLPRYWIFMHYLSLFKYPFECFMINEYGGEQGRRCIQQIDKEGCNLFGDGFLRQQGLKEAQKWSNLGVMLGFVIGYRVLCFLILWCRCCRNRN